MYASQFVFKTKKEDPADEFSRGAKLLVRAGFVEKNFSGVYTYLPLGFRVLQNIAALLRKEMDQIGGQEMLMPALTPKAIWETSERWKILSDIMYTLKDRQDRTISLAPTHEDVISALLSRHLTSNDALPFYLYQIQDKFRDEPRAKSGLMRTREFFMKDLYSFHESAEDLARFYEIVKECYMHIFAACALNAYVTKASGGTFSNEHSHEFMVESSAGEDRVFVCDQCHFAENIEVRVEASTHECPECSRADLREIKAVEVGNIFKLGTKFSEAFGLYHHAQNGDNSPVVMGSYGIGLGRVMGTIADVNSDEYGLIWPMALAPFQVYLISLFKAGDNSSEGAVLAHTLYKDLQKAGLEVLCDDRDKSPGEKFGDADLLGIPYRVVISEKTLATQSVEVKDRAQGNITLIPAHDLVRFLISKRI
ncbi:MAG: hypothetical protein KGI50_01970 [Patescibacteria group bacterium]|nr:hypothetical protein [Patescibacteria group bacterium]MDE2437888.1 hypothetical protein [Patescibacteria group bacterium]